MSEKIFEEFLNYGIAGAIIIVLIVYLRHTDKQHAEERKEWQNRSNEHVDKFVEVIKHNTEALTTIHGKLKGQKETLGRIEDKLT